MTSWGPGDLGPHGLCNQPHRDIHQMVEPQSVSAQGPTFNLSFSLLTTETISGQNPCASDPALLQ